MFACQLSYTTQHKTVLIIFPPNQPPCRQSSHLRCCLLEWEWLRYELYATAYEPWTHADVIKTHRKLTMDTYGYPIRNCGLQADQNFSDSRTDCVLLIDRKWDHGWHAMCGDDVVYCHDRHRQRRRWQCYVFDPWATATVNQEIYRVAGKHRQTPLVYSSK